MKKQMILFASAILMLGACTQNTPTLPVKTPETFLELIEGIQQFGQNVSYTISSDSAGYSETHTSTVWYRDSAYIQETSSSSAEADSIIAHQAQMENYIETNTKALVDKCRSTAVKCYQYDTHIGRQDTSEYIVALRQIEDSIPASEKGSFIQNYLYYPEFFCYNHYRVDENHDIAWMTYRNETKTNTKTETTPEETRQLVLDFIAKQKNVKQKARKYAIDKGFATSGKHVAVSFSRGMQKTDSMLVNATHYIIPVHGDELAKVADELWNLFSNHVKNRYTKVHGTWGLECVKHFEIVSDQGYTEGLMQMSIAKDEDGKMLHFQVGYDERGLHILMMDIETYRFFIPWNWLYLASIHNNEYVNDYEFGRK